MGVDMIGGRNGIATARGVDIGLLVDFSRGWNAQSGAAVCLLTARNKLASVSVIEDTDTSPRGVDADPGPPLVCPRCWAAVENENPPEPDPTIRGLDFGNGCV